MQLTKIESLLGCASTDPQVESVFVRYDICDRPHVKIDMEDADGPVVETQDWLINNGAGIEFGFEDEASWLGLDESERGQRPMILTQIYLYGDHPEVRPYSENLPFELRLSDDRHAVRAKFASLEGTRRSYTRDTWELKEFRVTVSYVEDGAHIGFVLCMLRPPPSPAIENRMSQIPTIDSIIGLLGKSWNDPVFRQTLVSQNMEEHLTDEDDDEGGIVDFLSYGFELSFSKSLLTSQPLVKPPNDLVLSEMTFYRDREMEAVGWKGPLPFGILFDDSPEIMMKKVSMSPDEQVDEMFAGYALWHFSEYSLQVHYSTIENLILRVRLLASGVWAAYS